MHAEESLAQPSSSMQEPVLIHHQPSGRNVQPTKDVAPITPPYQPSKQPLHSLREPETVDIIYKIVYSDRYEYSLKGNVYFRYIVPPERRSTSWFCVVAFHWHDVQAEFECVYHPMLKLFDDFKPIEGSLKGGSGGIRSVQISMWNFADRGPDFNPKHTVKDDNGNRIMLAVMTTGKGSAVRFHGKMVQEEENENEVWLSDNERTRLGLRS